MTTSSFHAKITKTVIDRLKPGDTVWDTELRGFGARRQVRCASYILKTRIRGRQKLVTIGKHGLPWTSDEARKQALAIKIDPSILRQVKIVELTVADTVERFKADHFPKIKPRTRADYEGLFAKQILPRFGDMMLDEIVRADMAGLHRDLARTPRRANMTLALLSKLMSWAESFEYRPQNSNPCFGIKKYPENKRQRYLSEAELGRLGTAIHDAEAAGDITAYSAAALRLLIFTGARLSEILTLKWDYVDFERNKIWLPDSKTGQKTIELNEPSVHVLQSLPRLENNDYVIIGQRPGCHLVELQKPWVRVRDMAGLKDVRRHDLRHSFASVAAAHGGSLPKIGKLLGHTQAQTTARYAHLGDDSVKQLNEDVGAVLSKAMKLKG